MIDKNLAPCGAFSLQLPLLLKGVLRLFRKRQTRLRLRGLKHRIEPLRLISVFFALFCVVDVSFLEYTGLYLFLNELDQERKDENIPVSDNRERQALQLKALRLLKTNASCMANTMPTRHATNATSTTCLV